ncbi:hypothetical protein ACFYT4_31710 [Streptomyces sp. NPDC004609]|uniref:hypothetical protein n=1 Tax=Streptomyces sp. NPDC004609 TaxID=3364704 RepID=UPI00367EBC5B
MVLAVRYGTDGDLSFAVAYGQWPGEMGPGYTDGLSVRDDHVFQLYYGTQNPKLPPPEFSYFHGGVYTCGFQMYMHTWSHEITGPRPDLLRDAVQAAGIPTEDNRNTAHAKSLTVVEKTFRLSLPRHKVLHQAIPAALIKGQTPAQRTDVPPATTGGAGRPPESCPASTWPGRPAPDTRGRQSPQRSGRAEREAAYPYRSRAT